MVMNDSRAGAASASLAERVAAFPRWHYEFDLGDGIRTPIFRHDHANRHAQRVGYFFEPLVDLFGGSLAGKRVLDLGCNAGFWALQALAAGAEFVAGVDGRQMHIDQAKLVMEAKRIAADRYRFEQGNVFAWEPSEPFDVVLCLGLLYHVARPIDLLERCARWCSDVAVIDSTLSRLRGRLFEIRHESTDEPRASVEFSFVLRPTRAAVVELCHNAGFVNVATLRPRFSSWDGADDYRDGWRRAFVASKERPLPVESEDWGSRRQLLAWSRQLRTRGRRKLGRTVLH